MSQPDPTEGDSLIASINVTPLVDITLVLLIIFMVTAKIIVSPAVPLNLPKAATAEATQVIFSVTLPEGSPRLVNGKVTADDQDLLAKAAEALAADAEVRAVIAADGKVAHRTVMHNLDLLRRAGVAKVAFGALGDRDDAR